MGGLGGLETVGPAGPVALGGAAVGPQDSFGVAAAAGTPPPKGGGAGVEVQEGPLPARAEAEAEAEARTRRDHELARRLQLEEDQPRLDALVRGVLHELRPTPSFQHRQNRLFQRLDRLLKELFGPHALLEIFGSSVCNLAGKSSDLDMTFSPGFPERLGLSEKKSVLRKVSKALQSSGMRAVPVLGARVPIVKITDLGDTWLAVDLSVENELPVFKSRLLHEYSLIDPRFSQLVLIVKAWAKARAINSAAHGTLNSFGLSLLVVHYLQVLPPQARSAGRSSRVCCRRPCAPASYLFDVQLLALIHARKLAPRRTWSRLFCRG